MLRFELDTASTEAPTAAAGNTSATVPVSLGTMIIREKMKVSEVRQLVFNKLTEEFKEHAPEAITCVRLRDGKNKVPGGPLRDERMISRCLLNMDDGRKIVVQVCFKTMFCVDKRFLVMF